MIPTPPGTTVSTSVFQPAPVVTPLPCQQQEIGSSPHMPDLSVPLDPSAYLDAAQWESLLSGVCDEAGPDPVHGPFLESDSRTGGSIGDKEMDWTSQGMAIPDSSISDVESWEICPRSPPVPATVPPLGPTVSISTAAHSSASTVSDTGQMQRLLAVVAQMERCLRTLELEQSQFANAGCAGLDKYPIGIVLHLSQEFSAIATSVLGGLHAAGQGMVLFSSDPRAHDMTPAGDGSSYLSTSTGEVASASIDTTTTLLVLTGHKWLVRMYSAVLGYFEVYLTRNSENVRAYRRQISGNPEATPTLQLGELAWANGALDLGKIHMALEMLQGAICEVQYPLAHAGTTLRNLVVTSLTNETIFGPGESNDDGDRLKGKFQLVRTLLREQMGL